VIDQEFINVDIKQIIQDKIIEEQVLVNNVDTEDEIEENEDFFEDEGNFKVKEEQEEKFEGFKEEEINFEVKNEENLIGLHKIERPEQPEWVKGVLTRLNISQPGKKKIKKFKIKFKHKFKKKIKLF
jgi:hypothetical protein